MNKYLLTLPNGKQQIALSYDIYRVGQAFGWVGVVAEVL